MVSITQISNGTDLTNLSGVKATTETKTSTDKTGNTASDNAKKLKNQFLNILLTQMQHQNPLDPMDTKDFTAQLTQFSSLEQQIDTNSKLDGLVSSLKQSAAASAFGYIGQHVDVASSQTAYQNEQANWVYALPASSSEVKISVTDAKGNIVYSSTLKGPSGRGEVLAGTYKLDLSKTDLPTGMADGTPLKLSISAKDASGKDINVSTKTTVQVDSIQSDAAGTYIMAGNVLYSVSDIKKVVKTPVNNNTTPSA